MKIAVVFSPGAGQRQRFYDIGAKLTALFKGHDIITCAGNFGGDYLDGAAVCDADRSGGYVETLGAMTLALLKQQPDIMVSVGGDGIAAYIVDTMLMAGYNVPMMGVAAGTANVGPIVCIEPEELDQYDASSWNYFKVCAVEVTSGEHVAFAFNDVVIGNTFLGTSDDGGIVNLGAKAMALEGRKEICSASADICTEAFSITKNGKPVPYRTSKPGQIIISPLDRDRLEGRAIYGALCSAAYSDCKGAIALTENVMISAEAEEEGMESFCPIEHMLFGPADTVVLSGFTEQADLILDGNPYIRNHETVELKFHLDIVTVAVPERKV
ncbi:MAG: hypothetical protein IJO77_06320 [Oscillospiraceae bacterium]|nr:hypothetical protein [Oscillospiraceae bacterium]